MAKIDEVMTGLNPKADARLARDIADHPGDATDMIPPVMLGPDSTARIDEHLARVRCVCGQPKPTDAIEGAIRAEAVVREFARLSLVADIDLALWLSIKTPPMPEPESSIEVWRDYTEALVVSRRLDAAFSASNRAAQDFRTTNLAALKAALGVE